MKAGYLQRLTKRLEMLPTMRRDSVLAEEQRRRDAHRGNAVEEERKVLVIGGAGYIGSVLIQDLLADGHSVISTDYLIYENAPLAVTHWYHPRYEFRRLDLRKYATWPSLLAGVSDVVILGALVGDPITKKYPKQSHQINVDAVRQLLAQCNLEKVNKVIFVSTCSNYGLQKDNIPAAEEAGLNPLSVYAKNKVEIELYLQAQHWNFHYTILRFATAFGLSPRMRFDLTVSEFTRELFLRRELLVYDPDTWRPYCHVRDLARAMCRVLDYPIGEVSEQVFNTGGDRNNHTKRSIVEIISKQLPGSQVAYKEHGSDPRNYRVNFAKIREKLDFEPHYTVEDGMKELLGALESGVFDDAEGRPNFYGNRSIPIFDQERDQGTEPNRS
jgi:nucleoside-diphosphate-sugar epimerase